MSRASSYRATAADLRRSSHDLADLALLHRRLDAGTFAAAGPVATLHDRSVEVVGAYLATASDEMSRLAVECDRRAEVCDAYDRSVRAWRDLPWIDRWSVSPPLPPAPWVVG